jgi:hypothetical protein
MDSNSPTDAELVTETLAGDREPFGQLYDRYARLVATVVAGVSGDWAAPSNIVSRTLKHSSTRSSSIVTTSSATPSAVISPLAWPSKMLVSVGS